MIDNRNQGAGQDPSRSPDDVNEILADFKKQKDIRTEFGKKIEAKSIKKPRSGKKLLLVLLPLLLGLTAWNFVRFSGETIIVTQEEEVQSAEFSIYMIIDGIDSYREANGRLPWNLEMLALDEEMITYEVSGSSYSLTAKVGTQLVTYNDGDDITPFAEAFDRLIAGEAK